MIILAEIIGEDIDMTSDSDNETTMKMNSKYWEDIDMTSDSDNETMMKMNSKYCKPAPQLLWKMKNKG